MKTVPKTHCCLIRTAHNVKISVEEVDINEEEEKKSVLKAVK